MILKPALVCLAGAFALCVACSARHESVRCESDASPPAAPVGKWIKVGGNGHHGSWGATHDAYEEVRVLHLHQGRLCAGLANPSARRGEVWCYDGANWQQIAGGAILGSWPSGSVMSVDSLAADARYLYAGTGMHLGMARVWRFDGVRWEQIGGDGLLGSWASDMDSVWHLGFHQGTLWAGLVGEDSGQQRALLYRFDGSRWELMTGDAGERGGWARNHGYIMAYVTASDGDHLFVGLAGRSPGAGKVWEFDGNRFRQIGGDGLNGSWSNPEIRFVEDLLVRNGVLYASLQASSTAGTMDPPVWKWDGTRWSTVGDVPAGWLGDTIFNKLLDFGGQLHVAAGGPPGSASVWKLADGTWTKIGGHGLDGSSWHVGPGAGGTQWIYTLAEFSGRLYAGLASAETRCAAQVWAYAP
jgi:hypothetical protein